MALRLHPGNLRFTECRTLGQKGSMGSQACQSLSGAISSSTDTVPAERQKEQATVSPCGFQHTGIWGKSHQTTKGPHRGRAKENGRNQGYRAPIANVKTTRGKCLERKKRTQYMLPNDQTRPPQTPAGLSHPPTSRLSDLSAVHTYHPEHWSSSTKSTCEHYFSDNVSQGSG